MFFCGQPASAATDMESFTTQSGATVQIACINHGSVAILYKGISIQIDPVAQLGGKQIDYGTFGKADYIFVTHEHADHLSKETIQTLSKETTRLYLNETSRNQIGMGEVLRNGDEGTLTADIKFKAVPAYNVTPAALRFHPKGNGNGYVFTIDGLCIYVAGDTEFIEEMKAMPAIDVAFLPANQPYTMTVQQCIDAAKAIRPKVLVPYHLSDTKMEEIKAGLEGSGIDVRLHESLR
ncbi:MAG: MBL fold metallo-hydrolase [Bacteroidales bacterium]|nr:MBL fold metallo-hydrolase [Bacteroidales bacterium]